jgi:hypothetical protein
MYRACVLLSAVLWAAIPAMTQSPGMVLPAGMVFQCTLDEPNLSSQTVRPGDPILCRANSFGGYAYAWFPREAYLGGRFVDYRDPGHFFGKGWMKLEFDHLVLPDGIVPFPVKLAAVPTFKLDKNNRIRGKGHARRDVAEWMVPPLWPWKVLTLPRRGPRPTLGSEPRIIVRLLEDVEIPSAYTLRSSLRSSFALPSRPLLPSNSKLQYWGSTTPAQEMVRPAIHLQRRPPRLEEADAVSHRPTMLMLHSGVGYLVSDYWLEGGHFHYITTTGATGVLSPASLDLDNTVKLNRERGVDFVIRSEPASAESGVQ